MILIKARPYNINWSGNGIWYQLYSAAALADTGISFELRIMFKRSDSVVFNPSAAIPLIPYKGIASYNLQDHLNAELEFGIPQLLNDAQVTPVATQSGQFYIEVREVTSSTIDPAWDGSEIEYPRNVVKGGVPEFLFNNNGYWQTYFPATKPFLTWQFNGRLAGQDERIYLAWYQHPDIEVLPGGNYLYRLHIIYSNLTTAEIDFPFIVVRGNVHYLPVGANMLNLSALNPLLRIWMWSVEVLDNSNPAAPVKMSEKFNFELDNRPEYNDIALLYRGSTGGLDTLRIRGVIESKTGYQQQQTGSIRKPYFEDGNKISASLYQLPSQESMLYTGDVGHLNKEEQDRLRDLYLHREIYQVKNKRWWPLNFSIKDFGLRKSTDMLWSLPIEFSLAADGDFFYAPKNMDFGTDYADRNVCDAIIENLAFEKVFNVDRTICTVTVNYDVASESGQVVTKVQYKLSTDDIWKDLVYPYAVPLSFNLAANQFVTVSFRAICPNSMGGIVKRDIVDTIPPALPGDPIPPVDNSRISNFTGHLIIYYLRINGIMVGSGSIPDGGYTTGATADTAGATLIIQTPANTLGSLTLLESNGVGYYGLSAGPDVMQFNAVNIVNGFNLTLR